MTLEERYRENVQTINARRPKGSAIRERERTALREKFEADIFERDGAPWIIHRLQRKLIMEGFPLVKAFYDGELRDADYQRLRLDVSRRYAERLLALGLVSAVFADGWVEDFQRECLALERSLVPVPRVFTGFTADDALLLCDPIREFTKRFLKDVHERFGVGRLKREPEIYGGIDTDLSAEELRRAAV